MSEKLNGLLNKIISTDGIIISAIEDHSSKIAALSSSLNAVNEKIAKITFDSFSTVNIETEGATSAGSLKNDTMASKAKSYSLTTSATSQNLYTAEFTPVNFGRYSLCLRIKTSNNSATGTIATVKINQGSTALVNKALTSANFTSNSNYTSMYFTFDYNGNTSAKQNLKIEILTGTTAGIVLDFDYAYISLLTPAIYA